ncbi:hypothetical protein BC792_13219 [Sphingobacterium allocomposti]|uniref:Uncharacterized protein n=1 Tax=Sphingobacterium allocomposti TaxID=415956 RepID=A0A5S5CWX1_9SPHI|nr:hypothetical protein BC792_13219 [Sphingobacterium composti Yoo et al. 2007 non Ten et al. 2007]
MVLIFTIYMSFKTLQSYSGCLDKKYDFLSIRYEKRRLKIFVDIPPQASISRFSIEKG